MRLTLPLLLLAALTATPAAAQTKPAPTIEQPDGGKVAMIEAGNAKMLAAIAQARGGLPDFFRHLANPEPGESGFVLKFDIIPGPKSEFIWAGELQRDAKGWTGMLLDDAVMIEGFKGGQRVSIPDDAVIDWGYWKRGVMQGSVTTRVVLDLIDPAEAAAVRKSYGW